MSTSDFERRQQVSEDAGPQTPASGGQRIPAGVLQQTPAPDVHETTEVTGTSQTIKTGSYWAAENPNALSLGERIIIHNQAVNSNKLDRLERIVLTLGANQRIGGRRQSTAVPSEVDTGENAAKMKEVREALEKFNGMFQDAFAEFVDGGGKPLTRKSKTSREQGQRFVKQILASLAVENDEEMEIEEHPLEALLKKLNEEEAETLYLMVCNKYSKPKAAKDTNAKGKGKAKKRGAEELEQENEEEEGGEEEQAGQPSSQTSNRSGRGAGRGGNRGGPSAKRARGGA